MNKAEYKKLLQDPRWKAKRLEIIERDGNKCRKCGSSYKLHVHHEFYDDVNPWEYKNEYLTTLCANCHKQHHKQNKNVYTTYTIQYNDDNTFEREDSKIETKVSSTTKVTSNEKVTEQIRLSFPTKEYNFVRAIDSLMEDIVSLSDEQDKTKLKMYHSFTGDIEGYISISISYNKPKITSKKKRVAFDKNSIIWPKK